MAERTCAICPDSIEHLSARAKYCGKKCSAKAARERDPSKHRSYQAKYRATAKGKAARERATYVRTCEGCGETWLTTRADGKYCSYLCRDYVRWGPRFSAWTPSSRDLVAWVRPPRPEQRPGATRQWVSGPCGWCGKQFTVQASAARYCSHYCSAKYGKAKRRGRESSGGGCYTWAEVAAKWLLIGKVCAYCQLPKSLDMIEPDHVTAISRGGSNSIVNVVPACKPCNGHKRDLTLTEWSAYRVSIGLAPLYLHASLLHADRPLPMLALPAA